MLAVVDDLAVELETAAGALGPDHFAHAGRLLFEHVQHYAGLYHGLLASPTFVRRLKRRLA